MKPKRCVTSRRKLYITIMAGAKGRGSCKKLLRKLNFLLFTSAFLLQLLLYVVKNRHKFQPNAGIHHTSKRYIHDLHVPGTNLCSKNVYQTGLRYSATFHQSLKVQITMKMYFSQHLKRLLIHYFTPHTLYRNLLQMKILVQKMVMAP